MVLRVGERKAEAVLQAAHLLHTQYPVLAAAVAAGEVPAHIMKVAVEAGARLPAGDPDEERVRRAGYEAAVLVHAKTETENVFRHTAARLVDQFAGDTLEERHKAARTYRHVRVTEGVDGMARIHADLPAEVAVAAADRIRKMRKHTVKVEAAARTNTDPGVVDLPKRSAGEIEADIFGDLLLEGVLPLQPVSGRGIRGVVQVIVPASVVGLAPKQPRCTDTGKQLLVFPSEIVGCGPIDAHTARGIAAAASSWTTATLGPDGAVEQVGGYQVRAADKRFLQVQDIHCRAPGCRMPAHQSEIDHTIPWLEGGPTEVWNLGHLCKRHHDMKHHTGWMVSQEHGVFEWVSPAGLEYVEPPPSAVRFRPIVDPVAAMKETADQRVAAGSAAKQNRDACSNLLEDGSHPF